LIALVAVIVAGRHGSANLAAGGGAPINGNARLSVKLQQLVAQDANQKANAPAAGPQIGLTNDMILFDQANRVGVRITAHDVTALRPQLQALGFLETASSAKHHLLEGFVPVAQLPAIGALGPQGLMGVSPLPKPVLRGGSVTSQADFAHEADRTRATTAGLNGSGLRIGVLSDSYNRLNGAAAGVVSGDLPPVVDLFLEGPASGVSDEGRGMVELIYDVAPGAAISFGSAFFGEAAFAQTVLDLANPSRANCQILVDDIGYLNEPFFQEGLVGEAVDQVVGQGVTFFSAAGNDADHAYESTAFAGAIDLQSGTLAHDFDPGPGVDTRQLLTIPPASGADFVLQWDDPFYTTSGVDTNLNILFLKPGTNQVVGAGLDNNLTSQEPLEMVSLFNATFTSQQVEVVIQLVQGPAPTRLKYLYFGEVTIEEFATNSSTIWGHPMAAGAMAVGAINYFDQRNPANFTSAGPSTILFDANSMPLSNPNTRPKPDFAAIQGTDTTFFGFDADGNGFANFFGTSAAAPHAAAIAALLMQSSPGLIPQAYYNRLKNTADATVGAAGPDNFTGRGLINAYDAIFGPATPTTVPFVDGLEAGMLSGSYETHTSGAGRAGVSGSNLPATGVNHMVLQSMRDGAPSLNEVILRADLTGLTGATLSFRQKEFGDADNPMSASFSGSQDSDGVALSVDGINWVRVVSLTGTASTNTYQLTRHDLTAIATANGLVLGPDTRIKFQQFGSGQVPRAGMAFDDISILNLATVTMGAATLSVSENAGSAQLTVVRAGDPVGSVQVDYATTGITATVGTDFTAASGTFIFAPGETQKTIDVPINPDLFLEGSETFAVSLSGASGGVIVTPTATTVTILDDVISTAPSNLAATATSSSTVRLQWADNCTNEDNIEVERRTGLGAFTQITTLTAGSTSFVDTGLSTDILYTYRVRAVRGAIVTAYSNLASLTISPFKFEVSELDTPESAGQAIIRVQRTGDILTSATVELKSTADTAVSPDDYQAVNTVLSFSPGETTKDVVIPVTTDNLLEADESFDLTLSNPAGPGTTLGDLSTLEVTILDDRARTAPGSLTATVTGQASIQLAWSDNCGNETKQVLERSADAGAFTVVAQLAANATTVTDTLVLPGVLYTYRLRAVVGDLESANSNTASVTITALNFELGSYTVREDDGTITLKVTRTGPISLPLTVHYATADGTATAPSDYLATSGMLIFAPGEAFKTVAVTIKNDAPNNALLEGNEDFVVSLGSANGAGAVVGVTGAATVTITDDQSGQAPGNLGVSVVSSTALQLNWMDRSGNETGFEIERKLLGGVFASIQIVGANTTTYTNTGLVAATPYIYRVRAIHPAGNSGFSNEASATTLPPAPSAPTALTAVAQDGRKVKLNWTDNSLDESGFLVERRTGANEFALVAALGENITTFTDAELAANTTYTYQVKASNAGGVSTASNTASATIPGVAAAPTGLTAAAVSSGEILLNWSHSGVNVTGFKIERQTVGGAFLAVGTVVAGNLQFSDNGAVANVRYTYRVRAINIGGESDPSNTAVAEISTLGKLKVTPANLKFGKVKANVVKTKTFKISNVGKGTLGGIVVGLTQSGGAGGPFAILSGGEAFTLVRGQSKVVTVRYQSAVPGNFQGTITIQSTDSRQDTHTVSMSATTR